MGHAFDGGPPLNAWRATLHAGCAGVRGTPVALAHASLVQHLPVAPLQHAAAPTTPEQG